MDIKSVLIIALVIACPLMHIFMMRKKHGGHNDTDEDDKKGASEQEEAKDKHEHGNCCH